MNGPASAAAGFSLLELLVAMAILTVLASIALPTYAEYIARSRRFEARAGLLEAAHWMERFRTERGRYDDPAHAGEPPAEFPWTQVPRAGEPYYAMSVVATAATYRITATAVGTMAGDVCRSLSIDEIGVRGFTGPGSTEEICWQR